VVIYLEDPASGGEATAVMAQKNRRFAPDLVIIPAGSSVSFPNEDPIFHNVFSLSKPKSFDLGNFPRGQTRTLKFPKAGVVLVNCYLHTNMTGVIVVTPNQWNARSDAAGHFTIRNAPPGKHTLVAWHKAAGFFRQTVEINNSRVTNAEFFMPLDENGLPATQALTVR
jgi:plastocyanin